MRSTARCRLGVTPEINAACTILIAVVAVASSSASVANKRREVRASWMSRPLNAVIETGLQPRLTNRVLPIRPKRRG